MLIVLEGIDGSGKSTQHSLLVKKLRKLGKKVKTIKFPRHGKKYFGQFVDDYLANKFGPATKMDARLASAIFALDRFEVKDKINQWLKAGDWVIPDRYTTSNLGHQLGKMINLGHDKMDEFIDWDRNIEYKAMGIPKPDLVIYLYLDFDIVLKLLKKRGRADAHESDHEYLRNSQKAYDYVCKKSRNWIKLDCTDYKNNDILPIKTIHGKVLDILSNKFKKGLR